MNLRWVVLSSALFMSGCMKSVFDGRDARCPFVEKGGCQSMEMVAGGLNQAYTHQEAGDSETLDQNIAYIPVYTRA